MATRLEQWQAGTLAVEGYPPWDGTGIPFPLDENGWPDPPDGGGTGGGTLVGAPNPATPSDLITLTLTLEEDPGEAPRLWVNVSEAGTWTDTGGNFAGGPLVWTLDYSASAFAAPSSNGARAELADATVLAETTLAVSAPSLGWTVAELKQFAADHDPPIDVPASGTKAEILAAILAYIEAHPEEN